MFQDALATAPLMGDIEKLKSNEQFTPSTKEEKGAATLHSQAIRLFSEEKYRPHAMLCCAVLATVLSSSSSGSQAIPVTVMLVATVLVM